MQLGRRPASKPRLFLKDSLGFAPPASFEDHSFFPPPSQGNDVYGDSASAHLALMLQYFEDSLPTLPNHVDALLKAVELCYKEAETGWDRLLITNHLKNLVERLEADHLKRDGPE